MRLPGRSTNIINYSSHIPFIVDTLFKTEGDVLELGTGVTSTPIFHHICTYNKRNIVSFENDLTFYNIMKQFENQYHKINYVDNWDSIDIERPWAFSFVDHSPAERRIIDIARLAPHSFVILVHDTEGRLDKKYHYSTIYPLFKYVYTFNYKRPNTTALSNFIDVKELFNAN